jgi:hypothetical protein
MIKNIGIGHHSRPKKVSMSDWSGVASKEKGRVAVTAKSNTKTQTSQLMNKLKKLRPGDVDRELVATSSSLVFSSALWTLALTVGPVLTAFHQHVSPWSDSAGGAQGVIHVVWKPFHIASYHQQHSEHCSSPSGQCH